MGALHSAAKAIFSIVPEQGATMSRRNYLKGLLRKEKAGLRSTLDVLQWAGEQLVARSNLNAATAAAYVAQARLLAAMGTLEQTYLFPGASAYNPAVHFDRTKKRRHDPDHRAAAAPSRRDAFKKIL